MQILVFIGLYTGIYSYRSSGSLGCGLGCGRRQTLRRKRMARTGRTCDTYEGTQSMQAKERLRSSWRGVGGGGGGTPAAPRPGSQRRRSSRVPD